MSKYFGALCDINYVKPVRDLCKSILNDITDLQALKADKTALADLAERVTTDEMVTASLADRTQEIEDILSGLVDKVDELAEEVKKLEG